jgi:hypothetical protein
MENIMFVATLDQNDVAVVKAAEDLPEFIHAVFYLPYGELVLDGAVQWTSEREAIVMQVVAALQTENVQTGS